MEEAVKVFLCEDDANLGPLLCDFLNAKGYVTELFTDGEMGYTAFMNNPKKWDICVLDVMMPKKDGYALAKSIKETEPEMPIIFLTAKVLQEDVEKGFMIGADDYLKKPFNTSELTMRIDAILRRVQGKRQKLSLFIALGIMFLTPSASYSLTKTSQRLSSPRKKANSWLCSVFMPMTYWSVVTH